MPRYGCCAQGLVFPNHHLQGLQDFLREPPFQFPGDMITEDYARDRGLTKWALDPSVMQHVGLVESSEGLRRAESLLLSAEASSPIDPFSACPTLGRVYKIEEQEIHPYNMHGYHFPKAWSTGFD
ncbi:hypothetical protein NM208_g8048 [Fusarium decemcellulare]|uniref:Uncharacterized protein n=1 Tax=Fusarium decemcellulare TaxID=57161 RepID=A0ACC1S6Y6_9HYPO|nr:hypothetical protein NM208_g8048 [Fusarium decemcellulare]